LQARNLSAKLGCLLDEPPPETFPDKHGGSQRPSILPAEELQEKIWTPMEDSDRKIRGVRKPAIGIQVRKFRKEQEGGRPLQKLCGGGSKMVVEPKRRWGEREKKTGAARLFRKISRGGEDLM